jgi:hypothetical protein
MSRETFLDLSAAVLGLGSIGFAAWALVSPRGFAAFMGTDPRWARMTGARDLAIGTALLGRRGGAAFALRATADTWDASTVAKPGVAAGAAGFGLWAATAAFLDSTAPARR